MCKWFIEQEVWLPLACLCAIGFLIYFAFHRPTPPAKFYMRSETEDYVFQVQCPEDGGCKTWTIKNPKR